jgi:hypothetical protein
MGLLRSCADAVLIGAGTMRSSPRSLWTAEQAYPPAALLYGELRRSRGRPPRPTLAVLSGSGSVDPWHPAFEEGALLLTSARGAARRRGRLPHAATILAVGGQGPAGTVAAVEALRLGANHQCSAEVESTVPHLGLGERPLRDTRARSKQMDDLDFPSGEQIGDESSMAAPR